MKFRWRLVVLPKFQTWFLFRFMIYSASLLCFLGASIYLWCDIVADAIFKLVGLISPGSLTLIKMNSDMALKVFAVLALVLVALAAFEAFIFSRKIAGPLFAFFRHLKKCEKRGRLEEFSLRKGDLFAELEDNFNHVVRAVNAKESAKNAENIKIRPFGVKPVKSAIEKRALIKLAK